MEALARPVTIDMVILVAGGARDGWRDKTRLRGERVVGILWADAVAAPSEGKATAQHFSRLRLEICCAIVLRGGRTLEWFRRNLGEGFGGRCAFDRGRRSRH